MRLANDIDYGLTAGFYGAEDEAQLFFDQIQAGVSYANRPQGATTGRVAWLPALWRVERLGVVGQERRRALLPAAVHARADPQRGQVNGYAGRK